MKIISIYCKQRWLVLAVCCFLLGAKGMAQTGIIVTYYNGTQQGYSVATTGKLYFENGNLQIAIDAATATTSIPVSIIQKITFTNNALPLKWVDFSLVNEKTQVRLTWKTENEINTSHFAVERSVDGLAFESIGKVAANNSTSSSYSFADPSPKTGISYYRLKQVDTDGKFVYSAVLTVNRTAVNTIALLPNPAADFIKINSNATGKLNVKIYAVDGKLMMTGSYASGEQISISQLTTGMYVAFIDGKPYKLIKQ